MLREIYKAEWDSRLFEDSFTPKLRRASRLMKIAVQLMESFLKKHIDFISSETALILCTKHGEIESTSEYLKNYSERELARPMLFQNSLHHSTLGFITQYFQLLGPAYTISHEKDPIGDAKALAESLLADGAPSVIILYVDHMPQFMCEAVKQNNSLPVQLLALTR